VWWMKTREPAYMKPLARGARGVGEDGDGTAEDDRGGDGSGTPPVAVRRSTSVVALARRRDSAPVYPGPDAGDDVEADVEASPSAPPYDGANRRPRRRSPMLTPAPLPPWADARARRRFVLEPLADDGAHARCHVLRRRGPLGAFPTYVLYLDGRDTTTVTLADAVPILVARKRKKAKCTHYVIGDDGAERSVSEFSASYVGKLKANFIGTRFELLDSGSRPRAWGTARHAMNAFGSDVVIGGHITDADDDRELGPPRRVLADIRYAVNVLGARGPRSMSAALFSAEGDARDAPTDALETAKPMWNAACSAYVLNFNGRVTRPSVKNFQLVRRPTRASSSRRGTEASADATSTHDEDDEDDDEIVVQFGRVDDDLFTLDFAHPLSPLQAFATCLSAFESKFARE